MWRDFQDGRHWWRGAAEGDLEDVPPGRLVGMAIRIAREAGVGAAPGGHEREAGAVV